MSDSKESNFPKVFNKCPWCGKKGTMTQEAWRETKPNDPDVPVKARQEIIPLTYTQGETISLPLTPCLIEDFDNCAECGREYMVKAQIKSIALSQLLTDAMGGMNRDKRR